MKLLSLCVCVLAISFAVIMLGWCQSNLYYFVILNNYVCGVGMRLFVVYFANTFDLIYYYTNAGSLNELFLSDTDVCCSILLWLML